MEGAPQEAPGRAQGQEAGALRRAGQGQGPLIRLLIVHGYEPSGHASAAIALEAAARVRGLWVLRVNVSTDYHRVLGPLIAKSYLALVNRAPRLWSSLYDNASVAGVARRWQGAYMSLGSRRLEARLREIAPDAVVSTSAAPMAALALAKRRLRGEWPVVGVITDFRAHGYWIKPAADLYLAPTGEAARSLIKRGIPPACVSDNGIPIHPAFRAPLTRERRLLEGPVLLLSGGSRGLGRLVEAASVLRSRLPQARLIAVCGDNARLKRRLEARFGADPRLRVCGGFDPALMRELMGAADLLIGKAGGVTTAEAMALGLPMVVFEPLPGQEARNAEYLVENGAAFAARGLHELGELVVGLMRPGGLDRARARARALGRPDAADRALDAIAALRPGPSGS